MIPPLHLRLTENNYSNPEHTAFTHHGQVCFSTERILVIQSVADKFIELLKIKALEFPQTLGVSSKIVKNAFDTLVDAKDKGARFILGEPERLSEISLAPTLVTGVTKEMRIWDEETFGPSATVIIVENDADIIDIVNESNYGLDAFLHTRDMNRAVNIARQLEVGRVRVNSPAHEGRLSCNTFPRSMLTRVNSHVPI